MGFKENRVFEHRIFGKENENRSILSLVQFKCKITIFIDSVHECS